MSLEDLSPNELVDLARRQAPKADLYDALLKDPETRGAMLALQKRKNPTASIPELDMKAEMETKLEAERAERRKLEEKVQMENIERRIEKERDRVKKEYRLTDTDMAEVEKIMADEKAPIPHYDAAAKVFRAARMQATPTPASIAPPIYSMPDKTKWGKGVGNPVQLNRTAIEMAYEASAEFRAGNAQ